jgi:hypothetical protein
MAFLKCRLASVGQSDESRQRAKLAEQILGPWFSWKPSLVLAFALGLWLFSFFFFSFFLLVISAVVEEGSLWVVTVTQACKILTEV